MVLFHGFTQLCRSIQFADNPTVVRGGYGICIVMIFGAVFYSLTGIHTSNIPKSLALPVPPR